MPAAIRVMIDYFAALTSRDLRGMADNLIYPHATYEGAECVVVNSAEELPCLSSPSMNVTGKGDHLIQAGAYDIMDNIQVYLYNPVRVCLASSYSRDCFQPAGQNPSMRRHVLHYEQRRQMGYRARLDDFYAPRSNRREVPECRTIIPRYGTHSMAGRLSERSKGDARTYTASPGKTGQLMPWNCFRTSKMPATAIR